MHKKRKAFLANINKKEARRTSLLTFIKRFYKIQNEQKPDIGLLYHYWKHYFKKGKKQ